MNKVMLIGNVGREPEVRYVDQGVAVARLSLATTERGYTLPNGTKVPDRTDWHNVVLWRRLAEIVEKYVHKEGKRHSITEVWADNMEMLTPKTLQMSQDVESSGNIAVQSATGKSMEPENDLPF